MLRVYAASLKKLILTTRIDIAETSSPVNTLIAARKARVSTHVYKYYAHTNIKHSGFIKTSTTHSIASSVHRDLEWPASYFYYFSYSRIQLTSP